MPASPKTTKIYLINVAEGAAYQTQSVRLDGTDYTLSFAWNEREQRWYFSIADDTGEELANGIKIMTNKPLTRFYQWDSRMPQGEFFALDTTLDGSPAGLYELGIGKRVQFAYFGFDDGT